MRPRDSQRERVYRAERSCAWYFGDPVLDPLDATQAFATKVVESSWFKAMYPLGPKVLPVRDGRRRRRGGAFVHARVPYISLPRKLRTRAVVLHELAHVVVEMINRVYNIMQQPHAPHGWKFANIELALVREVLGNAKADELRAAYDRFGVQWSEFQAAPRAKREMTPEQKQAATARLAAWRERKRSAEMFREIASSQPPVERIFIPDCPR